MPSCTFTVPIQLETHLLRVRNVTETRLPGLFLRVPLFPEIGEQNYWLRQVFRMRYGEQGPMPYEAYIGACGLFQGGFLPLPEILRLIHIKILSARLSGGLRAKLFASPSPPARSCAGFLQGYRFPRKQGTCLLLLISCLLPGTEDPLKREE